jgi:hypothetical protein
MKSDYTHVSMLLDRSGSMYSIKNDVIGGFNTFIDQQKKVPGKMTLTLAQFDTEYETLLDTVDIRVVLNMDNDTFQPRGSTALLDSTAKLIIETGTALAALPEASRPAKVLFVILTDGIENASRYYTKQKVTDMIKHQEENYKWQFIYIGTHAEAFAEADSIGVKGLRSMRMGDTYSVLSNATASFRTAPEGASFTMDQQDIDEQLNSKP